jgi:hypothetical protein
VWKVRSAEPAFGRSRKDAGAIQMQGMWLRTKDSLMRNERIAFIAAPLDTRGGLEARRGRSCYISGHDANHYTRSNAGASIVNLKMHRHISRPIMALAMLTGLIAALASSAASAQGTPAQQAACQGDAMRLCGAYIPDPGRVHSCMVRQMRNLSLQCRAQLTRGRGKKHR